MEISNCYVDVPETDFGNIQSLSTHWFPGVGDIAFTRLKLTEKLPSISDKIYLRLSFQVATLILTPSPPDKIRLSAADRVILDQLSII